MTDNPWDNQSRTVMPEASRLTPETECWKHEDGETPHCRWCGRPQWEREFLGPIEHNPSCPINAVIELRAALVDSGKGMPTEFLGRPIAYWVELDNYAKERNVDKLIGEIERLREQLLVRQVEALELAEQLRAYRGAERIARDQMEAPSED